VKNRNRRPGRRSAATRTEREHLSSHGVFPHADLRFHAASRSRSSPEQEIARSRLMRRAKRPMWVANREMKPGRLGRRCGGLPTSRRHLVGGSTIFTPLAGTVEWTRHEPGHSVHPMHLARRCRRHRNDEPSGCAAWAFSFATRRGVERRETTPRPFRESGIGSLPCAAGSSGTELARFVGRLCQAAFSLRGRAACLSCATGADLGPASPYPAVAPQQGGVAVVIASLRTPRRQPRETPAAAAIDKLSTVTCIPPPSQRWTQT